MPDWLTPEVSVAGAPPVLFCVDPAADDPVASWYLTHDWIDEPVQRAFLGMVEPGMRVLDLGSHLGTFSLPAAALGASVLAVDAASTHVELLNAAAARNGFEHLRAVHRAISDSEQPVRFVERSIHGHLQLPGEPADEHRTLEVTPATVDALLEENGWDAVDLIKLDIEGMEPTALAGMKRLHARGLRPAMVFEGNSAMLERVGSSICELRELVVELGYELLMIDHLNPGRLVETSAGAIQPECVCDYVAVSARPDALAQHWQIERPFSLEQTFSRLLDTAAGEGPGYRAHAAATLAYGPAWLRAQPGAAAALRALEQDVDPVVRGVFDADGAHSAAVAHTLGPEPEPDGPPQDMRVWARAISLAAPVAELDRPRSDGEPDPVALALEDASFHVRAGQLVGVLCEDRACSTALLQALAGAQRPHTGELELNGRAVLLARVGEGFEGALSVADNVAVFGAFLGCSVAEAERRSAAIAELAGLADFLGARLDTLDAVRISALALTIALELTTPGVLLVDRMPLMAGGSQRDWLTARVWQLRQAGAAVVQVVDEADELLAAADRLLWLDERSIFAHGHADSIFEASRRRSLGVTRVGPRVEARAWAWA